MDLNLITLKEAAEMLRIKPQTMRLYITNGRLPREFLCSQWHKRPLIFKDRLIEFINNPEKYQPKLCL
jgi:predicted site-specific integrase-resolvase